MEVAFSYTALTTRNLGFLSETEQQRLKESCVFMCGVGGMGGACLQSLVRSGIGHFIIADMDVFEVSNFNRQVFSNLSTVNMEKTEATRRAILEINPEARIDVYGGDWLNHLPEILAKASLIVNGMDDIGAGVQLYRAARKANLTMIDAYASSLPSVYVTRPQDPTPEERLNYPTLGKSHEAWTEQDISGAFRCELAYVMGLSSTRHYIDLALGAEMAAGTRKRMSFAPMVITTGNLMAYEVIANLLGKKSGADYRGYFFNPYTGKTERPPIAPIAWVLQKIAARMIAKLIAGAA